MRSISTVLMVAMASHAGAQQQMCTNNIIDYNICDEAKRIAKEDGEHLPQALSETVTLLSLTAEGNVLTTTVQLQYDRTYFELALIKEGQTYEDIKRRMFNNSKDISCMSEPTRAFIGLGGHTRFEYQFKDGDFLFDFYVSVC